MSLPPTGDSTIPVLGRLVNSDPRTVWQREALQFTPWLLANPDYLADALGIELQLEAAEHPVGGFSLDLIGKDLTHDCVLIVENQLGGSDHSHLGQLLTYAAGTGAATIVWIATEMREEHRQAIDWLNEHTDENVRLFALRVEVVRIGDSAPAAVLRVAAQPNDWQKQVRSVAAGVSAGGKSAQYLAFWTQLLERIRARHPTWTRVSRPQATNWMTLKAIGQFHFNLSFVSAGRLRAELYLGASDGEWNLGAFRLLASKRAEIESAYGRPLEWEELPGKLACRVADNRSGDVQSTQDFPAYLEWFEDALGRWLRVAEAVNLPALGTAVGESPVNNVQIP